MTVNEQITIPQFEGDESQVFSAISVWQEFLNLVSNAKLLEPNNSAIIIKAMDDHLDKILGPHEEPQAVVPQAVEQPQVAAPQQNVIDLTVQTESKKVSMDRRVLELAGIVTRGIHG